MKNFGIWLDKEKAHIVTVENNRETMHTVYSGIENYHVTGSRIIGGPKEIAKDRKFLEREKQQFKSYFEDIVYEINDADALVIFGPGETNKKFSKELMNNHKTLSTKIKGIKKADSMTDNQVIAWVRDYFKQN